MALSLVGTVAAVLVPRLDILGAVDAIVVLGGGAGERIALGRRLAAERGVPLVHSAEVRDTDLHLGPEVEVVRLEPPPVNTAAEARATRELADTRGWSRIAVVTSTYHVNRSRMLFAQCLGDRVDVTGVRATGSIGTRAHRYARELAGRIAGATIRRAC